MKKVNIAIDFFLCLFLGYFGIHKFYEGKKKIGFLYLFTLGVFGFGWIADIIILFPKYKQSRKNPLNINWNNYNNNNPNTTNRNTYSELEYIDNLDGYQFEHYIGNLLEKLGYQEVKVTSASGDYGVDILATKDSIKYAFQCKLYSNPVGNKAVQEVIAGRTYYNCHVAIVVTNNTFTSNAKNLAESANVLLWDRTKLEKLISKVKTSNTF
jgi:restriction system protein|nr:MAG TPA: Restriction endonuclease [Caudoviricetes sp.]